MANYNSILSQVRQQLRMFSENEKIIDENHVREVIDEIFDSFKKIWKPSEDMRSRLKSDLALDFFLEYTHQSTQFGSSDDQNHQEWLDDNRKADIDQSVQWESFYEYVAENRTPQDLLNLSRNADLILGKMEDPSRRGTWKSRSLVIGEVQSGKTENMLALCNRASAAGYRFIIILAGLSETLRIQTQERFDEGFIGAPSTGAVMKHGSIGVGKYRFKPLKIDCDTGAGPQNDWVASKRENNIHPQPNGTVVLVIKKHTSMIDGIVKNIDKKWEKNKEGKVNHMPIMVIDDECDNASINMRGDEPTPINKSIRKLLNKFTKYSYVGFTATAYANIFINHVTNNDEYGPDLFPDYITLLSTPPSYCGFEKYFPQSDEYSEIEEKNPFIDLISDNLAEDEKDQVDNFYLKRKVNGKLLKKRNLVFQKSWLSPTHEPSWILNCNSKNEELPDSLKSAIQHFILSCALKKIREISNPNIFSMMVHVSYYTDVQHQVINHILKYLKNFELNNVNYQKYENELKDYFENSFSKLIKNQNNIDQLPIKWVEIKNKLRGTIANIDIIPMNNKIDRIFSNKDDAETARLLKDIWEDEYLNVSRYDEAKKRGSDCICIGGNQLSRGLTLTGLTVSYFLRTPKTMLIDTMTQMGRWFGYRGRYDDICKLYTSSYIYNNYREMNEIKDNLTAQLREMKGASAREIGLYLVTQGGNIKPTRPGAMRNAESVTFKTNFSGAHPQQLKIDLKTNEKNRETVNQFLSEVDKSFKEVSSSFKQNQNCLVWEEVDTNIVVREFLDKFKTPKAAHFLEKSSISHFHKEYIEEVSTNSNELRKWTVVFVNNGQSEIKDTLDFNGREFTATLRTPSPSLESGQNPYTDWDGYYDEKNSNFDVYPIKALTDTTFEEIDLLLRKHPNEWLKYENEVKDWEKKKALDDNIRIPKRKLIKKWRSPEYGLLLIYPIFPTREIKRTDVKLTPYYCYALSFPISDYAIKNGESMFKRHNLIGNKVLQDMIDWEKQNPGSDYED